MADMRKEAYSQEYKLSPIEQVRNNSQFSHRSQPDYDPDRVVEEYGMGIGEAADMYGDLETAEDYGYVTRGYVNGRPNGKAVSRRLTNLTGSSRDISNSSPWEEPLELVCSWVSVVPSPKPAHSVCCLAIPSLVSLSSL